MKALKFIGIGVFIFGLGVLAFWGFMELTREDPVKPLTDGYIQYRGFKQVRGGYVAPQYNIVSGIHPDTIIRAVVIIPKENEGARYYLIGLARDNTFMMVDALFTQDDLDRWVDFLRDETPR
jgi:hypothetical protein